VSLVSGPLNRDEFKYIASRAEISVGLYDQDTYGGTAARECTELGCIPFWISCNEYSRLARDATQSVLFLYILIYQAWLEKEQIFKSMKQENKKYPNIFSDTGELSN
jgi:hypothetical protein